MSDTPRTDAAAIRCACSTYVVPSEFARELERENAALRAISIEAMISNTAFRMKELERENTALRADLLIEEERSIYWRDNECKAMAENAALRVTLKAETDAVTEQGKTINALRDENTALRSALTTLLAWEDKGGDIPPTAARGLFRIARAALDSARKEAQP